MSKIHTTEPLRPISGYRYEREHQKFKRYLVAIVALLVFVGFKGWLD